MAGVVSDCGRAPWDALAACLRCGRVTASKVVECAIGSAEFDSVAFMEALVEAKLGGLSGCVGQLVAVARYWSAQGELPGSAADAMKFEIEHLLRETDERRRPRLPMDWSMRLA